MYRCHSLPSLTSVDGDAAEQRDKRSTAIINETPWSSDYDSEVQNKILKNIYQSKSLNRKKRAVGELSSF